MKSEHWNWSDLRVFLAVVRAGSTLAASGKLGMAQPTVARRIEALEHATGLVLFDRDTRGFRPTEAGRALLAEAEAVEAAVAGFAARAAALADTRPIRITAYGGNFSPRMIEIVTAFSAQHPGVSFEFLPTVKALDLIAGEADIALRLARREPDPRLICRKISDAKWTLFAGHSYAKRFGLPRSADDLAGHRFVTFAHGDVPEALHDWLTARTTPEQILASYSELDLMHAAIRSGQGLGISNVKLNEDDATLIPCFDEIPEIAVPHLMLIAPQAYRRPEVKAFVSYFAPRYAAIFR